MSPENANVILVEDDTTLRRQLKEIIERSAHKVVVEVGTLTEVPDALNRAKELGVNCAVVDGNLTENDNSGRDGETIAQALRIAVPEIKIVSCSSQPQTYGDAHISKRNFKEIKGLGQVITNL